MLLTIEADIRYFTGFLTQFWHSPTRRWFVIVPATGKPVAAIPEIEKIAWACTRVSRVFEDVPAMLVPGTSEREIFRRFKAACLDAGLDDMPSLAGARVRAATTTSDLRQAGDRSRPAIS